ERLAGRPDPNDTFGRSSQRRSDSPSINVFKCHLQYLPSLITSPFTPSTLSSSLAYLCSPIPYCSSSSFRLHLDSATIDSFWQYSQYATSRLPSEWPLSRRSRISHPLAVISSLAMQAE
ncbi:hypothetical protein PMAYCL1PPCAC_16282, partial [Pristionchus mayeri]